MDETRYRELYAFAGSRVRALALGVLANAESPLSGYRVAQIAGLSQIKVYEALRAASRAGIVRKSPDGYRLVDADLGSYLRAKVRLRWSEERRTRGSPIKRPSRTDLRSQASWFDPSKYRANPGVAKRYRREFLRPSEKNEPFSSGRPVGSRKRT